MSLQTWKEEFYPAPASAAAAISDLAAINHSLRKWEGLTPENLKKHGCASRGAPRKSARF